VQTYTHCSIGAVIGALGFAHEPLSQAACVVGAVAPDLVIAFQYAVDVLRSRPPLVNQPRWMIVMKEASHSLLLWGAVLLFFRQGVAHAFCVGVVSHILIDGLTHKGVQFTQYDSSLLWPFTRYRLGRLIGLWEYRYGVGVLSPKPFERVVLIISTLVAVKLFWHQYFF